MEKNQIATFGLLTKHIGFFQKQKFMGLLYSEQEENIYINAVSSFPKIHALLQFLFQLLFDFWDLVKVNFLLWRNISFDVARVCDNQHTNKLMKVQNNLDNFTMFWHLDNYERRTQGITKLMESHLNQFASRCLKGFKAAHQMFE